MLLLAALTTWCLAPATLLLNIAAANLVVATAIGGASGALLVLLPAAAASRYSRSSLLLQAVCGQLPANAPEPNHLPWPTPCLRVVADAREARCDLPTAARCIRLPNGRRATPCIACAHRPPDARLPALQLPIKPVLVARNWMARAARVILHLIVAQAQAQALHRFFYILCLFLPSAPHTSPPTYLRRSFEKSTMFALRA